MKEVQLFHGDCLKEMQKIPDKSIDLVLTDPPYEVLSNFKWDKIIPLEEMWTELNRITKDNCAILLFGQEPFSSKLRLSNLKNYRYDLIWQKEAPANFFHLRKQYGKVTEFISVFYKKQPTYNPQMRKHHGPLVKNKTKKSHSSLISGQNKNKIIEYNDTGERFPTNILKYNRVSKYSVEHPTQKPIPLLEELIKSFSNEKDTILDFTMGSGSTGVAALKNNRKFIGIELNKDYYNLAQRRIEEERLFQFEK